MTSPCLDQECLEHPVSLAESLSCAAIAPTSLASHCHPGSSTMIDNRWHLEGSLAGLTKKQACCCNGACNGGRAPVTIDMLPDVALLEIFDVYVHRPSRERWVRWDRLVHVCRRWRYIVFGSPRRLDLQLRCTERTPVRKMLGVWPPLPIIIRGFGRERWDADNIVAALEHNDRIYSLDLWRVPNSILENVLPAMQQPFPALTDLSLRLKEDETTLVIPASFLGGSAPRLVSLILDRIPFPGLPKLLFSATHLVRLDLVDIPHSGYISPDAMATCLSVLTRLEGLDIGFKSPRSRPDRRRPPPQTRVPLPLLTGLSFRGVGEYLNDLVARIDVPLLKHLRINLFHQLTFDIPQVSQFISRTPNLKARDGDTAHVAFSDKAARVTLLNGKFDKRLHLGISCSQSDWQLSSLAQVCSSFLPPQAFISVVDLNIFVDYLSGVKSRLRWQDDIEANQWLELLLPFTAVKEFSISSEFTQSIAPALQEAAERVTEVLPALMSLLFKTPPQSAAKEAIGQFVAARQLAGHPITIGSNFHRKKNQSSETIEKKSRVSE